MALDEGDQVALYPRRKLFAKLELRTGGLTWNEAGVRGDAVEAGEIGLSHVGETQEKLCQGFVSIIDGLGVAEGLTSGTHCPVVHTD